MYDDLKEYIINKLKNERYYDTNEVDEIKIHISGNYYRYRITFKPYSEHKGSFGGGINISEYNKNIRKLKLNKINNEHIL